MPPRQPHPVRPSAARGTRCLATVGPRAASATSERGSEARRLLQRNWGRAAEVSVASFLHWGALPATRGFRVGSPCTVARSFGQQKASTTPTAWPKLTQSLTQWDLWRGGIATRIKWLRLTAKHLKSAGPQGPWGFESPSRHFEIRHFRLPGCRPSQVERSIGSPSMGIARVEHVLVAGGGPPVQT